MSKTLRWGMIFSVIVLGAGLSACGDNSGSVQNNTVPSAAALGPKQFTATGAPGADFPDAKDKVYAAMLEMAIRDLVGDGVFQANSSTIGTHFLSYVKGYKYVKDASYVNRATDASGHMILTMKATVDMVALRDALRDLGVTAGTTTTVRQNNTASTGGNMSFNNTTVVTSSSTGGQTSYATQTSAGNASSGTADTDLTGVDLTSLSFLVYYDANNSAIRDAEDRSYAATAVSMINSKLTGLGIETFDPAAMDQIVQERRLLQQSTTGSVGVGMLVAEQVQAELYAEVIPTMNYNNQRGTWQTMLNVKVYVRTTGALLLNTDVGGREYERMTKDTAIKASMRDAVDKIVSSLSAALKRYVVDGRSYFIRLQGISSYRDASSFSTTIKTVPGVLNVTLKNYSNQDMTGDYVVRYQGNPLDLLDKVMTYLGDKPGFENLDVQNVRGNEIIFSMN